MDHILPQLRSHQWFCHILNKIQIICSSLQDPMWSDCSRVLQIFVSCEFSTLAHFAFLLFFDHKLVPTSGLCMSCFCGWCAYSSLYLHKALLSLPAKMSPFFFFYIEAFPWLPYRKYLPIFTVCYLCLHVIYHYTALYIYFFVCCCLPPWLKCKPYEGRTLFTAISPASKSEYSL